MKSARITGHLGPFGATQGTGTESSRVAALLRAGAYGLFLVVLLAAPLLAGSPPVAGTLELLYQSMFGCLILLAAAAAIAARRLSGETERLATPVDLPILLLLAATALSVVFSVNRHASVVELLRLLSQVAAFYLAASLGRVGEWGSGGVGVPAAGRETGDGRPEPATRGRGDAATRRRGDTAKQGAHSPTLPHSHTPTLLWAVLVAGAAWAGARGVWEYVDALRHGWPAWRVFGGLYNPNVLAGHLALAMPLMAAGALALRARPDAWRRAWPVPALLLAISGAAVAFTGSRTGLLAVGLGLALFAVLVAAGRRRLTRAHMAVLAIGLVILGIAIVLAVPTLRYRFLGVFREGFSLSFRFTTWVAAVRIFLAHPLAGTGAGTFGSIMTRYSDTGFTQSAHSHFLQTAAETGVLGLLGLVALLVAWAAALVRSMGVWKCGRADRGRETGDGGTPSRAAGPPSAPVPSLPSPVTSPTPPLSHTPVLPYAALAGVLASSAHALVDIDWSIPATGWVLWALMGLGLGAVGAVRRVPARPAAEGVVLAVLLVALLPGWRIGVAAGRADDGGFLAGRAYASAPGRREEMLRDAESAYQEALHLDPYSPDTHREFGRFLGGLGLAQGDASRLEEGREHLRAAMRLSPTNGLNAYHLGILEMRSGRTREADAAFRRALEWDPQNPYTLRHLGQLHERSSPRTTLQIARRLVEVEESPYGQVRAIKERVDPDYAFAHYWLAREHLRAGRRQEAAAELSQAGLILRLHRKSLGGQGGRDLRGDEKKEPDADVQALEADVRRALQGVNG